MRGEKVTLPDIELQAIDNLACGSLYDQCVRDCGPASTEVEQRDIYRVVTECYYCTRALRLCVRSNREGLRNLGSLLLQALDIVCGDCGRKQNG